MVDTRESNKTTVLQEYILYNSGFMFSNKQNPDCTNWIKIDSTSMDYSVIQKNDNSDYYQNMIFMLTKAV